MPKGTEENKEIEERFKNLEFHKSFSLSQIEKAEGDDPYYFEGIASTYKNADVYNDIFLEGSLDDMIGKKIPVMPNHSWDILKAIGHGTLEKDGNKIIVKGYFVKDDPDAEKIVKLKKAGVPISLSIGGSVIESTIIKRSGQLYREISKGTIREVSTVLAGANPKAKITKSEEGEMKMAGTAEKNENVVQIPKEEMDRIVKSLEDFEKTKKTLEAATATLEEYSKALKKDGKEVTSPSKEQEEKFEKQFKELKEKFEKQELEYKKAVDTLEKMEKENIDIGGKIGKPSEINFKKHVDSLDNYIRTGVVNEFLKSLNTGVESGGALIPDEKVHEILAKVKNYSKLYADAKVYTMTTNSTKIPVRQDNLNAFQGEKEGGVENGLRETELTYKNLTLEVGKISAKVRVTQEMIDDSDFDILGEILSVFSQDSGEFIGQKVYHGVLGEVDSKGTEIQFEGVYKNEELVNNALLSSMVGDFTSEDIEAMPFALNIAHRAGGKYYCGTKAYSKIKAMRNKDDGSKLYPFENGVLKVDQYEVEEEPFMDGIIQGKFPILFCNPKEFYTIGRRKNMTIEKDRDADNDSWAYFARMRSGSRVRKPWFGTLLKIRSADDPAPAAELVSIAMTPKTSTASAVGDKTFTVMGTYSDGSQAQIIGAKFVSSNVAVATIENTGIATVKGNGTTTITATYLGKTAASTLTVTGIA